MRILMLDDQANMRTLVRLALSPEHELIEAAEGAEAIEKIRSEKPDLLILDVMMPGSYNGLQVLEWVRLNDTFKDLPVIILSGLGQDKDIELATRLGASLYLVKPFRPSELKDLVAGFIKT